jgi:RNA polymerase sigma-70 factor, ECF subfamily
VSFFPDHPSPARLPFAEKLSNLYGFAPNFVKAQSQIPEIVDQELRMLEALLGREDHLTRAQKETVLLAAAAQRGNEYAIALHSEMLKLYGVSQLAIDQIMRGNATGPEAALVAYARRFAAQPSQLSGDDIERLRMAGFNEQQILEVILLLGMGEFLSTVQMGTGAAPDFASHPLARAVATPKREDIVHLDAQVPRPTDEHENAPELVEDPDRELVLQAQAGDMNAFEALVERHSQLVYRSLMSLLANKDEAKDALQDTFLKAFQNLRRFERKAKFATWLMTIAINTGNQRLRDRRPTESLDGDASVAEAFRPRQVHAWQDDPESGYSKIEQRMLLERSIQRLPVKYRVAVVLRDVQQLSTEEAAAALGLGVPALKARLLRGRLMLREALAPHFMGAHSK